MLKGVNVANAAVFGAKMPPARKVHIGKYLCMGPPVCHVSKRCEMLTLGAPIRHLGVSSEYSNIRKLKMDNMDQGSIDAIACLQQLEVLSIGDNVMGGRLATGINLPYFPKLRKVCAPTYTSVKGLARCERLAKLWVNRLSRHRCSAGALGVCGPCRSGH
ncbi:hypothetical protein GHT06_003812 [Daphnia sinensis]|uniref:Uncharacterized protein n=1 Tax=Daphnia sinensis TaxID=1820382 RepID=A0AAD5KTS9_9CRUS|nr:hypothetical protein GHT06_003812 [Daphnia sinensis]